MQTVELAQSVKTRGLQDRVRTTMKSCRTFQIETEIPDDLRRQLERLDRAAEAKN